MPLARVKLDMEKLTLLQRVLPGRGEKALKETGEAIVEYINEHWSSLSPSTPGQPPAVVSGALKESLEVKVISRREARVEALAEHGLYLEYGTIHMGSRPFLYPAVQACKDEFKKNVRAMLEDFEA